MSYGFAYSSLFVICKTVEQRDELLVRFQKEKPGQGEFIAELLSASSPLYVDIDFPSSEVSRNLDNYLLELDRWLYENFNLRLKGHWQLEVDDGDFRCEIAEGKISDAPLNWLNAYTVEQINGIRRYAESTYPPESTATPTSDDPVFICPSCKMGSVEVVMINCTVSEEVRYENGELVYGIPKIHDSLNSHYQCSNCGWRLPVTPNTVDDDALEEWLRQQPQTPDAFPDYAEKMFQFIRGNGHQAVKFCNWRLDLKAKRSMPPFFLPGLCPTAYPDADPSRDDDLRMICRDFVHHALASECCQEAPLDKTICTASDINELEP